MRLKKLLLIGGIGLVVLVGLLLLVGPAIATSVARSQIRSTFSQRFNGDLKIGGFDLSIFSGRAEISGLEIVPKDHETVTTLEKATVEFDTMGVLTGSYVFDVKATGAVIVLTSNENFESNVAALLPKAKKGGSPGAGGAGGAEMPDFTMSMELTGCRLVFRKDGDEAEMSNIDATVKIPSIHEESTASATFEVPGGGKGSVVAKFKVADRTSSVQWRIDAPSLEALTPAAKVFARIESLEGSLKTKGTLTSGAFPEMQVSETLRIDGLKASGPMIGPEPVEIEWVDMLHEIDVDADGKGAATIVTKIPGGSVKVTGTFTPADDDEIRLEGDVKVDGDLQDLTRQMASLMKLQKGYRLQGTVDGGGLFSATLKAWEPQAVETDVNLRVRRVVVIDPDKKYNPLSEDVKFKGKVSFDPEAGTLKGTDVGFRLGAFKATGGLTVHGLQKGGTIEIADSEFTASVKLGRFIEEIKGFVDVRRLLFLPPDERIEGRVMSKIRLEGTTFESESVIDGLTVREEVGQVVLKADGKLDFKSEKIDLTGTLASKFAEGAFTGILEYSDPMRVSGAVFEIDYLPEQINPLIKPWLGPADLVGSERLKVTGTLSGELSKKILNGKGTFKADSVRLDAEGFSMTGSAEGRLENGRLEFSMPGKMNGGDMKLDGHYDAAEDKGAYALVATGVKLNDETGNILEMMSPLFTGMGQIQGTLEAELRGTIDETVHGTGSIRLPDFKGTASPFMGTVLTEMGMSGGVANASLVIPDLVLEGTTVRYEQMELRWNDTLFKFAGSLTVSDDPSIDWLDRPIALDLNMEASLRKSWMHRLGVKEGEEEWLGKTVIIPIGGTARAPSFDFATPVKGLVSKYAKKKAEKKIRKKVEDKLKDKLNDFLRKRR